MLHLRHHSVFGYFINFVHNFPIKKILKLFVKFLETRNFSW